MIVVNLFGGPCLGKSTLSAELFTILKKEGVEAVQVGEYVKECIQAGKREKLDNELFIFAEQARRLRELVESEEVDVAICDWPLLNAVVYDSMNYPGEPEGFAGVVLGEFARYNNLNYRVMRLEDMEYSTAGRVHTFVEAVKIDEKIHTMLKTANIKCLTINNASAELIVQAVMKEMEQ